MRVPVVVAAGVVVLAAAVAGYVLLRPAPRPAPAAAPEAPRPAPAAEAAPAPAPAAPPAPAPVVPDAPRPAPPAPAPVPTTGTLRIETDVDDALVFLDRMGVGTAPVTIPNVTPGAHRLDVSATGYDGHSETIEVEPGARTISIRFREIRLDARLAAVHKHRFGSCDGELIATPEGVRYQAADGKDSFSIALSDLTAFEIDYLDTNLRLRTREGRTYNFTDPDGNADRLFVFHQNVEKVRQRLQSGR